MTVTVTIPIVARLIKAQEVQYILYFSTVVRKLYCVTLFCFLGVKKCEAARKIYSTNSLNPSSKEMMTTTRACITVTVKSQSHAKSCSSLRLQPIYYVKDSPSFLLYYVTRKALASVWLSECESTNRVYHKI
jgi:hypothetical protein